MFKIVEERDGFYVVDEKGKKLNAEPLPTREMAQAFLADLEKEKLPIPQTNESKLPVPPPVEALPMGGLPGAMGGGMPPIPTKKGLPIR